jgi:predicted GH43/DUF377 family glycosyl hydrolase
MEFFLKKCGHIYMPDGAKDWMRTHAQVPRPFEMKDRIRIYFTTRGEPDFDGMFVSKIAFIDVEKNNPQNIINISSKPILDVGEIGKFDQFGVMPGNVIKIDGKYIMYYTGWQRDPNFPYITLIGRAESYDLKKLDFNRSSVKPILGTTSAEPFLCNGPYVVTNNNLIYIFYASALSWIEFKGKKESHYIIMNAKSEDNGITWIRNAVGCIPTLIEQECQNSPTIIKIGNKFHMWFCFRHATDFRNPERGYKLGYACSEDLINWHRDDSNAFLHGTQEKWDKEMQCYPGVIEVNGRYLLFYCGNNFGGIGFGFAEILIRH